MASDPPVLTTLPEQFGPYRIFRPLGKGGMRTVYLANDTRWCPISIADFPRASVARESVEQPVITPILRATKYDPSDQRP